MLKVDGFYLGYFSGAEGYGVGMFILRKGVLVGADANGVKFDGTYQPSEGGSFSGLAKVVAPPNVTLVQGIRSGANGLTYTLPFNFPRDFLDQPFIRLDTPFGAVNVKLERLRDLEVEE